jgi:hypothetical protein
MSLEEGLNMALEVGREAAQSGLRRKRSGFREEQR